MTAIPRSKADRDGAVTAWASVLKVHAAVVPELDRRLQQEHGLPLTWYDVLLELNAAPARRLTMSELGQRAVVSRTRVSRVVDELVKAGHVERAANPDDGRSAYAVLTAQGRRLLRTAAPTYLSGIEELFGRHLRPEDARTVAAALTGVLDAAR
jgi:DNA-binding MarR family transcriptional regulator